jgi:hypothetical protein
MNLLSSSLGKFGAKCGYWSFCYRIRFYKQFMRRDQWREESITITESEDGSGR